MCIGQALYCWANPHYGGTSGGRTHYRLIKSQMLYRFSFRTLRYYVVVGTFGDSSCKGSFNWVSTGFIGGYADHLRALGCSNPYNHNEDIIAQPYHPCQDFFKRNLIDFLSCLC